MTRSANKKVQNSHPMRTFLKGAETCLKKYDRIQLGAGPEEVPLVGGSESFVTYSQIKSQESLDRWPQGRCSRLFHRTFGYIDGPACDGDRPVEMQRHFPWGHSLFAHCQERQGRQKKDSVVQRCLQTSLRGVHPLETKHRRTDKPGGSADSIQQLSQSYDNAGNSESIQKSCCKGRFALLLSHSLPETYLRQPSLQGQRLQLTAGTKAAWSLEFPNYGDICGRDETRYASGTGKVIRIVAETTLKILKRPRQIYKERMREHGWRLDGIGLDFQEVVVGKRLRYRTRTDKAIWQDGLDTVFLPHTCSKPTDNRPE